ncbi:hypothetical protein TNCV_2433661 [Trichonephila clavipes]|nr:hypothetical protein TNCV_2433661 [Trichonephila clavipes]
MVFLDVRWDLNPESLPAGKYVKSRQTVKSLPCDMWPGIVLQEYRVECALPQDQSRFHSLCDAVVCCQTVINVYQRVPVIRHCGSPSNDAWCWTNLMLREMDLFVKFSGSPPSPSMTVISLQTEMRFIHEQYPMPFNGPGTMTQCQVSSLALR